MKRLKIKLKLLFQSIKYKFKKKETAKGELFSNIVYYNHHIKIVHDACKECYNSKLETDIEKMAGYIERRVATGHESILEHSNVITYHIIPISYIEDLTEVFDVCKYLTVKSRLINDEYHVLLGGSIRGYKHIFRYIKNINNIIAQNILNTMYDLHACYFEDFVKDGIMDTNRFMPKYEFDEFKTITTDKYTITNIDKANEELMGLATTIFDQDDLLDLLTITVHFTSVSRSISHQLVRHRNAITQLSQRYVNYSKGFGFLSPALFKPDKYDKDKKYIIKLKDNNMQGEIPFSFTLQELGDKLMSIYPQLIEQGLLKEDARAYLPNNAETSLYMTFTLRNMISFLYLRCDQAAQAEVNLIAKSLKDNVEGYILPYSISDDIYENILPVYKLEQIQSIGLYDEIDEEV